MLLEKEHILVVDDYDEIRNSLAKYLVNHGMRVTTAANGAEMDNILKSSAIDLIVLDVMMPGEDGLSICRRIQSTTKIPIILLTALAEETDRIIGLEVGADDYVVKPFNPRELLARIKSVMRRAKMLPDLKERISGAVRFEGWKFNTSKREIIRKDGVVIRLSTGEHMLLVTLIEHCGRVLSRDQLLDLTKGRDAQLFDRSIDIQISRLRQKLEIDPKKPKIILTEWGGGYVFSPELEWL